MFIASPEMTLLTDESGVFVIQPVVAAVVNRFLARWGSALSNMILIVRQPFFGCGFSRPKSGGGKRAESSDRSYPVPPRLAGHCR
jgi:hypothetical protein